MAIDIGGWLLAGLAQQSRAPFNLAAPLEGYSRVNEYLSWVDGYFSDVVISGKDRK
ncbi:MAG: hypothetical protein MJA27_20345 [Pseudanabaenales cyanobacterium]|nr:hypothetical protein [Pseudanabaenales cyanobacterium]